MAHKFEPADEKYWAEQRQKIQAAIQRQKQIAASKTNFKDLFSEEPVDNTSNNQNQK